jgi:ribonuclease HI
MAAKPRIVAYTDGGCRGNPGVGGWGFLLIDRRSGSALERRGGEQHTTNNRMEMLAAIEVLRAIKGEGRAIEIRSDSRYLVDMCRTWMAGWKKKGWKKKGGPIKNLDLVQQLDELKARHEVTWTWVEGHSGEPGNEHADQLTNAAMDDVAAGRDASWERRLEASPVKV